MPHAHASVSRDTEGDLIGIRIDGWSELQSEPDLDTAQKAGVQDIFYRDLCVEDYDNLRSAHVELFPVDYEEAFFERIVHQKDGLESLAAFSRSADGGERLIGFVTARDFQLYECDPADRELLGLDHPLLHRDRVTYILTLGVAEGFRKHGVASRLVQWVVSHGRKQACRAVYLHVIAYNDAAIGLYRKNGFCELAMRPGFYYIGSGRQPDPSQQQYDAYLYAVVLDSHIRRTPLNLLALAFAPLRDMVMRVRACLPWAQRPSNYFGGAELPPLNLTVASPAGSLPSHSKVGHVPPWLRSLFTRKDALRQQ